MCWVIQSSRSSTVLNTSVRCCSRPILLYRTAQSLCSGICPDPHVQTQAWVSRCVHRSRRRPLLLWLLVFDCIGLVLLVLSLCGMLSLCLMNVFVGEARQTLPQLVGFLNSGLKQDDTSAEHDSTMATALHSAHALLRADPEIGKSLLNNSLIKSLFSMSSNLWVRTS